MNWINWGIALLETDKGFWGSVKNVVTHLPIVIEQLIYGAISWIGQFFYLIWRIMACFCDFVEGLFRSLAGLGGDDGSVADMATSIIQSDAVQMIFRNLVSVSTGLLIFFTILKIIQQQYKEKEGGNPYIIVFRMFKGLLMYFFVTAAVLVGIYASGVVFRALDAATKNGATSISGQIFNAMAYDANRLRVGKEYGSAFQAARDILYYRISSDLSPYSDYENEKYTVAQVTGDSASDAQVRAAYEALPINSWRIVNRDGSLSEISASYGVDLEDDDAWYKDTVYDPAHYQPGTADGNWSGSSGYGNASYKNDFFQALDIRIQPEIDLTISPLRIFKYSYSLEDCGIVDTTVNIMGSSVAAGYQKYMFLYRGGEYADISEDNLFSIDIKGGASIQGTQAAANFSLDAFASQMPVDKILMTITANVLLTNLLEFGLNLLPQMPLYFAVGPVGIDLRVVIQLLLYPVFNELIMGNIGKGLAQITSGDDEANEEMIDRIKSYVVLQNQPNLEFVFKQFEFTSSFSDLWSQLTKNWENFEKQLTSNLSKDSQALDGAVRKVDQLHGALNEGKAWINYKSRIKSYNDSIANYLTLFIKYLDSYAAGDTSDPYLEKNMQEIYSKLEAKYKAIKADIDETRPNPSINKATVVIPSIYLPAFEINGTVTNSLAGIANAVKNGTIKINLTIPNESTATKGGYQVMDWDAYGTKFTSWKNSGVAELTGEDGTSIPTAYLSGADQYVKSLFSHDEGYKKAWQSTSGKTWSLAPGTFMTKADMEELMEENADPGVQTQGVTVRASSASNYVQGLDAKISELQKVISSFNPKTNNAPTENALSAQMLTFRNIGTTDVSAQDPESGGDAEDSDTAALKEWIKTTNTVNFPGEVAITPIYSFTAEDIDAIMVTQPNEKTRYYLTLADNSDAGSLTERTAQRSIVGTMSYTDPWAVAALYTMGGMNYFVGYLGIIICLSVYLNFTFGLIQRVVNMSVLYVMSPVTIAFYPFDDGQKFQGQFVQPFYKQTISSFAIIISLNLFFILMSPVVDAVKDATGSNFVMAALALIAFCSMLPKIRDTITEVLGAAKIEEKKLGSVLSDAGRAIGASKFKTVGKGVGNFLDRRLRSSAAWREKKEKMANALRNNKVVGKPFRALESYHKKKKAERDQMQANIDAARKSGDFSKLTAAERNLMKLQNKAAQGMLNGMSAEERQARGLETIDDLRARAAAGDKDAQAKLKELEKQAKAEGRSMQDVLSDSQKDARNKFLGDSAVVDASHRSAFSRAANGIIAAKDKMRETFKYTPIGDLAETIFNPATGMIAGTELGKFINWFQPSEQDKRLREMNAKEEEMRRAKYDIDTVRGKQLMNIGEGLGERDKEKAAKEREAAALLQAAEGVSIIPQEQFKDRYIASATAILLKEGKTGEEARKLANEEWENNNVANRQKIFVERGGLATYAKDLQKGTNGAVLDDKYLEAARKQIEDRIRTNDIESLTAASKQAKATTKTTILDVVDDFQNKMNLPADQRLSEQFRATIVDAAMKGEDATKIARRIATQIPRGEERQKEILQHLQAANFDSKVAKAKFDFSVVDSTTSGALNYLKKTEKARQWAKQDLNVDIDNDPAFNDFLKVYRSVYDVDAVGGMQQQEEALYHKYDGDISNPDYLREKNELAKKYFKQLESAMNQVGSRSDIRRYDYSTRQVERERAEFSNMFGKEFKRRFDYQLKMGMTPKAKNTVFTDTAILEMKIAGNHLGAALLMDQAVDAAKQNDWAKLDSLDIDQVTKDTFKEWGSSGAQGLKELNSVKQWFDITRKWYGDAEGPSGSDGKHIDVVRNQVGAIMSVVEAQKASEFCKKQAAMAGAAEEALRRKLAVSMRDHKANFADAEVWRKFVNYMDIRDQNGNKVEHLGEYFSDIINRTANGKLNENDHEFQDLINKLGKGSSEWSEHDDLEALVKGNSASALLRQVTASLNEAVEAAQRSREQDKYNEFEEKYVGSAHEKLRKLESSGGGDSKVKG